MRHARFLSIPNSRRALSDVWASRPLCRKLSCCVSILSTLVASSIVPAVSAQTTSEERVAVIDEVWDIVESEFYDPRLNGLDAPAMRAKYQKRAQRVPAEELPELINDMLGQLKASHTAYLSQNDPRHYQILGIFDFLVSDAEDPRLEYEGIGIETVQRDGSRFVQCVYDGFSAHEAGVKYGDEIVSVDGQPWDGLRCFRGKANRAVTVRIRRHEDKTPFDLSVRVQRLNGRTMFEEALRASVRKFKIDSTTVGYMHIWNYAGSRYHEIVREQLLWGDLKDCDAAILDLRDGWGGASLDYLNLFREPLVRTSSRGRDGDVQNYDGVWSRPVVLLVNERSTSGKEMYAYAFKKHDFGQTVGNRTAGAVMAGSPRLLDSGDVLYLATRDVLIDGQRIEGVGVEPTIPVERPLPYAAGADSQLDAALEAAFQACHADD